MAEIPASAESEHFTLEGSSSELNPFPVIIVLLVQSWWISNDPQIDGRMSVVSAT